MKKILPPTYLFGAIVLMIALHFLLPIMPFFGFPWNLLGVIPLIVGLLLAIVADRVFQQRETTVKPFETSTALVTDGVFHISRHPMYLGFTVMLLGLAWLLGSISPFVIAVAFAVLMDVVFIRVEERMMAETFGEAWNTYKRSVRRWL
jgi:protein-S-isoprenylcysteine O-methyltransferase Ste14